MLTRPRPDQQEAVASVQQGGLGADVAAEHVGQQLRLRVDASAKAVIGPA